ncbi:hypothetical protein CW306_10065 [Bacillus sp. BA3]|nr:hypothetical protein CW306_10065 [Bacillus sp. BA3]
MLGTNCSKGPLSSPQVCFLSKFKTKLIGTEGARLLREKRVQGRPRRRKSAEGGPPAESECPTFQSTFKLFYKPKKNVGNLIFIY